MNSQKSKLSLESFIQDENSHCYTCIKEEQDTLDKCVRDKIKNTLCTLLERPLTDNEYKIFNIFTGIRKLLIVHGVSIAVGTTRWGMLHLLTKHFRDNGDKNGGRVDYIDIIKIAEILEKHSPTLQVNKRNKYIYKGAKKTYILITRKYNNKWFLHTFYSEDIS